MNKAEILEKLLELNIDDFIVISGASLVMQGIKDETEDIDLYCTKDVYDKLNWQVKIGADNKEIKYKDCFEIADNFKPDKIIICNGYKVASIEDVLKEKVHLNRQKDFDIIIKLKQIIESNNI